MIKVDSIIDKDTGEIIAREMGNVIRLGREPAYVKVYLEDIQVFHNLSKESSVILGSVLRRMDFNGNIYLNGMNKQEICEEAMIAKQTLDNYLSLATKKKILSRIGRGTYAANPELFGRGTWKEIFKRRNTDLWLKVNYDTKGNKTLSSSFRTKDK